MNNFHQDTFYFNELKTKTIDNNLITLLNDNEWTKKNFVLNLQMYEVYFTLYNNK
jgi:hypothetical protein